MSTLHDFTTGGFTEILSDPGVTDNALISRVVFCSGKIYYDLLAAREERKADHVALLRVEQLYPFAADQARDLLARYSPSAEVVWAQEEPRNMGPWRFIRDQHPAPARRYAPRSALRGPVGKREPGDGVAGSGISRSRRKSSTTR